jgi:hypothetical protein
MPLFSGFPEPTITGIEARFRLGAFAPLDVSRSQKSSGTLEGSESYFFLQQNFPLMDGDPFNILSIVH